MCGICGIASTRGAVDPDRLRRMAETLYHRGPDSEGAHVDGPIGIAARRLAIIDLTGGDQPIANEDGSVVVVQNGEIYNYRELMQELERAGHRFRTHCDTEVLVHGYEQWGAGLWERLRGMFAVAVWDASTRRLVLARDRFGIKPLYYRDVDGELSFASELDALPKGEIDLDALEGFLAFNVVPAPLSIFKDIRKLLPGHVLTWHDGADDDRALRAHGPAAGTARRRRSRARRGVPRAPARLGARAPRRRRARRRAPLRRRRLRRARGARSGGVAGARAHVLDRLRGGVVRRARRRARGRAALRDRAPRADATAGRGTAAAGARGGVRRAVRGLVRAPDLPRLEARGRGREGRALRRGRRRAVRRLLHVRRRPARGALRPARGAPAPGRRAAAELVEEGELRLPAEEVHARRGRAAARAPPSATRRSSRPRCARS